MFQAAHQRVNEAYDVRWEEGAKRAASIVFLLRQPTRERKGEKRRESGSLG